MSESKLPEGARMDLQCNVLCDETGAAFVSISFGPTEEARAHAIAVAIHEKVYEAFFEAIKATAHDPSKISAHVIDVETGKPVTKQ